jgi:hypothetical protein
MCRLCETKPVYEFTNKRKLCKTCFIDYFRKKVLYTIRKFSMISRGDIIGYKKTNNFKGVVLESVLQFVKGKTDLELVKLPSSRAKKIATDDSIDSEAGRILNTLIEKNASGIKEFLPKYKNIIKPLCLFLDEEILLYAKLTNLKFKPVKKKENKTEKFINEFEKKHPEVKRAIINGILELY